MQVVRTSFGLLLLFLSNTIQAQQLPEFSLKDLDNNIRSFDDLKGEELTLFDFWATWCKPCRKAIPELNKIYDVYKERGVQIIGVNCDGPRSTAKVAPMAKSLQIKYPVLLDINSDLMNEMNLANFPTLIAVNSKGKVVYIHEGFGLGDEIEIKEAIDDLIE
jgi:thiol-disulfide isomerase/thioredoxin